MRNIKEDSNTADPKKVKGPCFSQGHAVGRTCTVHSEMLAFVDDNIYSHVLLGRTCTVHSEMLAFVDDNIYSHVLLHPKPQ